MGKKRIVKQKAEDLLKEREKLEAAMRRETKLKKVLLKEARIYISSSYNNTICTLTDLRGNTICWTSAGYCGFKGTKKGTPYAASKAAELIAERAKKLGVEKVEVYVKGIGSGRESAIRSLAAKGLDIVLLKDVTPIPHDGPRPPKVRRV